MEEKAEITVHLNARAEARNLPLIDKDDFANLQNCTIAVLTNCKENGIILTRAAT